jgi:uncharacterized membrane protein YbhN (UPF0104 family)
VPDPRWQRGWQAARLWSAALKACAGLVLRGRRLANGRWAMPLRVSVAVVLLGLVFFRNNLWNLPAEVGRVDAPLLAAMFGCSYVAWLINTYRWQRILAAFRVRYDFRELFRLNLAGVFYGLALPGQISGEVLKALRLADRSSQRHVVYVSIFLDRVYGLIGLALLGCVALVLDPPQPEWLGRSPSMVVLVAVVLAGVGVLVLPWLSVPLSRIVPSTHSTIYGLAAVLISLTRPGGATPPASTLVVGCGLGLVAQALIAAIHWGVALALGLSLSPLALTWILALGTIVGLLPVSFGGLGVREATYVGLLSLFGVSAGPALALSLMMFMILVALGLTGGILDLLAGDVHSQPEML